MEVFGANFVNGAWCWVKTSTLGSLLFEFCKGKAPRVNELMLFPLFASSTTGAESDFSDLELQVISVGIDADIDVEMELGENLYGKV